MKSNEHKESNSIYKFQKEKLNYSKNQERWKYSRVPYCRQLLEEGKNKEEAEEIYEKISKLIEEQRKECSLEKPELDFQTNSNPSSIVQKPSYFSVTNNKEDLKKDNANNIFLNNR